MANAFAALSSMQRLAAALTVAGQRGGFPPAQAATLIDTATGLWRSRSILEDALDSAAVRRRALAVTPPASAAQLSTGASSPVVPAATAQARAVSMSEAARLTGYSRMSMLERAKQLGLCWWVEIGSQGEWRIAVTDLEKLKPEQKFVTRGTGARRTAAT